MPRKKMTKHKSKPSAAKKMNKKSQSLSQATLTKIEKEFFTIPSKLVKNATKQLTLLQKKNSKLTKSVAKAVMLAEKLEKKLFDLKHSKKVVKRKVATALKKQHQLALKDRAVLSKEHQAIVASLMPLEAFHAKFNFLGKQLLQLEKEWATIQKGETAAKKSKTLKAKKEKIVKGDANVASIFSEQENELLEERELALSQEVGS